MSKEGKSPTKGKPKKQEPDETTKKLLFGYRKKCDNYGIPTHPAIKTKLDEVFEKGKYEELKCNEELGAMQIRALMQSACDVHYQHLKKIVVSDSGIGDEGLRFICKYISTSNSLLVVDLMNNNLTPLGCQFLMKTMLNPLCGLKQLKIDNNHIRTVGLKDLTVALRQNNVLDKLSLKYCGIDAEGARYIQEILANIKSKLRHLKLQGNIMGNEGVYQVLRAVQFAQSLEKINIADTGMQLLDYQEGRETLVQKLGDLIPHVIAKNALMIKYDLRFNPMPDIIGDRVLKAVEANNRLRNVTLPGNVNYDVREELDTIMRKRAKIKVKAKKSKSKKT